MNDEQYQHLIDSAKEDEIYQDIESVLRTFEPEYRRILHALPRDDQHILNIYVNAREGLESRVARTAYFLTPKR